MSGRVWRPEDGMPLPIIEEEDTYTGPIFEQYQEEWHKPPHYLETPTGMQGRQYDPVKHDKKSLYERR